MMLYPYPNAFILTDALYSSFGGNTGSASDAVRQAAYQLAESAIYYDLETPLQLTTFTGTYLYTNRFALDHTYVQEIIAVQYLDANGDVFYTVSGTANYEVNFYDQERGVVLVYPAGCLSNCRSVGLYPDRVTVIYTAGIGSGTSYDPRILTALTQYATIQINEMVGYGNEAPGDIGIKRYDNQEYSEERVSLLRTAYGSSAKANFIHQILSPYRRRRVVGW